MKKEIISNPPSDKSPLDHTHFWLKAALNSTPLVGAPMAAIFETVFNSPIDKRKQEWLEALAEIINELHSIVSDLTPEILANNEVFVTAQLQAANIAIRTHHKERLAALKNAVKNSFLMNDIDEIKKMIFIRIIEDMTPLHFKVLHFLCFPNLHKMIADSKLPSNVSRNWGGVAEIWDENNTQIKSSDPLLAHIVTDLHRLGLSKTNEFYQAPMHSSTTQMGTEFVNFIELEKII